MAVAVGQIMAYHKRNTHKVYDWNKILDKSYDTQSGGAADFLYDVAEGVNMKYGMGGSYSTKKDAANYFKNSGYSISGYFYWLFGWEYAANSFNFGSVKKEIDNNRPVYLAGAHIRTYNGDIAAFFKNPYSYIGHAWVADGYKIIGTVDTYRDTTTIHHLSQTYTNTWTIGGRLKYLHMNWGWGYKKSDGWGTYDYWKPKHDPDNFQYNKKMITVKP